MLLDFYRFQILHQSCSIKALTLINYDVRVEPALNEENRCIFPLKYGQCGFASKTARLPLSVIELPMTQGNFLPHLTSNHIMSVSFNCTLYLTLPNGILLHSGMRWVVFDLNSRILVNIFSIMLRFYGTFSNTLNQQLGIIMAPDFPSPSVDTLFYRIIFQPQEQK